VSRHTTVNVVVAIPPEIKGTHCVVGAVVEVLVLNAAPQLAERCFAHELRLSSRDRALAWYSSVRHLRVVCV